MKVRPLTLEEMLDLPDGTEVEYIKGWDFITKGTILTRVVNVFDDEDGVMFSWGKNPDGCYNGYDNSEYFDAFEVGLKEAEDATNELGVYRPELETRKVGKIRVELVDEGFPLALRAVAKVMTWAQTAKGYKDHDWQNLPDAEVALAAAASRHRTDHIEQRVVEGLDTDQCLDVESNLHHKAHEAFGVLAQLELMLRGKFVDKHRASRV